MYIQFCNYIYIYIPFQCVHIYHIVPKRFKTFSFKICQDVIIRRILNVLKRFFKNVLETFWKRLKVALLLSLSGHGGFYFFMGDITGFIEWISFLEKRFVILRRTTNNQTRFVEEHIYWRSRDAATGIRTRMDVSQ